MSEMSHSLRSAPFALIAILALALPVLATTTPTAELEEPPICAVAPVPEAGAAHLLQAPAAEGAADAAGQAVPVPDLVPDPLFANACYNCCADCNPVGTRIPCNTWCGCNCDDAYIP